MPYALKGGLIVGMFGNKFPPRVIGPANEAAICEVGFQLALRVDELISVMKEARKDEMEYIPGVPGTPAARQVFLTELIGLQVASFPRDHNTVPVLTTITKLVQNSSGRWIAVVVTNLDNAQPVFYGNATLTDTTGPLIAPRTKEKVILPPNETLYGIVDAGSVDVAVSTLARPRLV